jgi:prepilin-type N-terminal cleavage/methylation domain-containing protein
MMLILFAILMISMILKDNKQSGFTIVELLIAIVVIAILAAISIVAYNGIQNRVHNTSIQNDLSNLSKKMQMYHIDYDRYPSATNDSLSLLDFKANGKSYTTTFTSPMTYRNLIYCTDATGSDYTVLAKSLSGDAYKLSSNGNITAFSTTWTTQGAGALCTSAGFSNTNQLTGFWSDGGLWQAWTGVPN